MKRALRIVGEIVGWIIGLNFVAFFVINIAMGGSARLGGVEEGVYYLRDHGNRAQVSPQVYHAMYVYETVTIVTFAVAFVFAVVFGSVDSLRNRAARRRMKRGRRG